MKEGDIVIHKLTKKEMIVCDVPTSNDFKETVWVRYITFDQMYQTMKVHTSELILKDEYQGNIHR